MRIRAGLAVGLLCLPACGRDDSKPGVAAPAADRFARTTFAAHTRVPIEAGKNVVWCATFQMAWDELTAAVVPGGPLELDSPAQATDVASLNSGSFPKPALDVNGSFAFGGLVRDGGAGRFVARWSARLPREPAPTLPTEADAAVAFGRLMRDVELPFLQRIARPMRFGDGKKLVDAYGFEADMHPNARRDIGRFWLHGPAVYEISLGDSGERLVLSRMPASATLEETWSAAASELASDAGQGGWPPGYELVVPMVDFDATHRFSRLEGSSVAGGKTRIAEAVQNTRVRMDRTGTVVQGAPQETAYFGDNLELGGPFLLALLAPRSTRPYLLLWIENDELLKGRPASAAPTPLDLVGEWRSEAEKGDGEYRQRETLTLAIDGKGAMTLEIATPTDRKHTASGEIVADGERLFVAVSTADGKPRASYRPSMVPLERTAGGLRLSTAGYHKPWNFSRVP